MNDIKDFIESLGISVDENNFKINNDVYTLEINDSNDYSQLYSILSNSDEIDLDTENVSVSEDNASFTYLSDDFDVALTADFVNDEYKLKVKKVSK